jgi:uncharacterized integral membrane protein
MDRLGESEPSIEAVSDAPGGAQESADAVTVSADPAKRSSISRSTRAVVIWLLIGIAIGLILFLVVAVQTDGDRSFEILTGLLPGVEAGPAGFLLRLYGFLIVPLVVALVVVGIYNARFDRMTRERRKED